MLTEKTVLQFISKSSEISKKKFTEILTELNDCYYNNENDVEVSDDVYDLLKDAYEDRFGTWKYVGAEVDEKLKKKLRFWLGSQDKYKPTDTKKIKNWVKKFPKEVVIEPKFDGVSGYLECHPNGTKQLFTRGNGEYGTDISNLLKYIKLPKVDKQLFVRGELIIPKKVFEKHFQKDFKNGRNLVSGIVNSKQVNIKVAKKIDFVVYEIIDTELKPSQQVEYLSQIGFRVPTYNILQKIDVSILENELSKMKKKCIYDIDGIVCTHNDVYIRNTSRNPKYAFAFKVPQNGIHTTVEDVQWNASKHGVLKPRIKIKKVHIDGSDIQWVTGFNAKYIKDNNIGKGTVLSIVKSGDVIPYIQAIIKSTKYNLPDVDFTWNDTNIDIVLNENNDQVYSKKLLYFCSKLDIKGVGDKTAEKFVKNKVDSIDQLLKCSVQDFESMSFGPVESTNLYNNIQNGVKDVKLSLLMSATGIFGFGLGMKKIQLIIDKYGDITKKNINEQQINQVDGWSDKSATKFLDNIDSFKDFLERNKCIKYILKEVEKKGKYVGSKVVFSGTTGKDLIDRMGATKMSSVSKKTDLLVVANKNSNSGKIKKARELGIDIIEISELNL